MHSARFCATAADIFHQRCPRCRAASMFRNSIYLGFAKMHNSCPVCGLHFAREPGYFLGAMYFSYLLALAMIAGFALLLWLVTRWRIDRVVIWAVVAFLPFAPTLSFLSRVIWIYLDQTIDPEKTL